MKKKEGVHVQTKFSHEVVGSEENTVRAPRSPNGFNR
jgi:hypothetical protein